MQVNSHIGSDEHQNEIQITIEEFDKAVELKKALDRLKNNEDYKIVIENHYLKEEADRLSAWIRNPRGNIQGYKDRDYLVEKYSAIGFFENFMHSLSVRLDGIDNPEQRVELINQLNAIPEEDDK